MSAAKSSSAQDSKVVGLGWSGQNSNSGEEDALLLLASAASMAPEHKLPHLWLCETVVEVGELSITYAIRRYGYGYGDMVIRQFSKNKDTPIRQVYIFLKT